jgi:CHASE2 domain-containing sensor protein
VLSGKIPATKYADKIVLIGATAPAWACTFPVPGYAGLSPAEMIAHITSSILGEHFIVQPVLGRLGTLGFSCWWRPTWSRLAAPVRRQGGGRHAGSVWSC